MNGRTDGCLAPSAVSKLKWWCACLQQNGAALTGCVENVWTVCKTKACAERALTGACNCCCWSLQPWQPPDTFNRWGPKWSKGQWMHHTPSPSLPLCNTLFRLLLLFYINSLRLLIHPPSLPLKALLSLHLMACIWPHEPRLKWHFSPAASQQKSIQCCQWPSRWSK